MKIISPTILCLLALGSVKLANAETTIHRPSEAHSRLQQNEQNTKLESLPDTVIINKPKTVYDPAPPPPKTRNQHTTEFQKVDERILWHYYRQGDTNTLKATIKQWKQIFPGWQPPPALMRLLAQNSLRNDIKSALNTDDLTRLRRLNTKFPTFFDCSQIDNSWGLADLEAKQGGVAQALQIYQRLINQCQNYELVSSTLAKAKAHLADEDYLQLLAVATHRLDTTTLEDLRYAVFAQQLQDALKTGNNQEIESSNVKPTILKRQDAELAKQLGWYYFNQKKLELSKDWFHMADTWLKENEEINYGLALIHFAQRQFGSVTDMAQQFPNSDRMQHLNAEVLLTKAWQAFERREWTRSRSLLTQAQQTLNNTQSVNKLNAWLDYHAGQYQSAAKMFASLYHANPDQDIAQGLVLSYSHLNDRKALAELRAQNDPYVANVFRQHDAQTLFYNKHFLAAYALDATYDENLYNIDTPYLSAGYVYRSRSGDAGLDKMDLELNPIVKIASALGNHKFDFHVAWIHLSNGHPHDCVPVGTLAIPINCGSAATLTSNNDQIDTSSSSSYLQQPTTQVFSTAFELSYSFDGLVSPYFKIGLTPDGPVGRNFTFLGGTQLEMPWGKLRLEGFSQPVKQTLLSYVGMVDPYSNIRWGGVMQNGGTVALQYQLDQKWWLTSQFKSAALSGKAVADNWMVSGSFAVGYNFSLPHFDYFSFGPALTLEHYDKNSNHFTLGHGGYFSPEFYFNTGLGLNFLTSEGKKFIAKGNLFGGFQYFNEATSPWFPKDVPAGFDKKASTVFINKNGIPQFSGPPYYAGHQQDGIAFNTEITAAWLPHPHLQYGFGAYVNKTADYQDYGAGIYVKVFKSPRKALMSTDLEEFLFSAVR